MKTVAIIPIKLNNERLPGKNTRFLGDKPLIKYCLEMLLDIEKIQKIYVYCSSEEIITFLPEQVTFLKRSQELDLSTSNFTQIFGAFKREVEADVYVYAHATAPFVTADTVRREVSAVLSGEYDSAFCAERIQDFLWQGNKPLNFCPSNLPRSQDLPVIYRETSGVYVFNKEVFEKQRGRIGIKPYIAEIGRKEAVDINTAEDFYFAEIMLNSTL